MTAAANTGLQAVRFPLRPHRLQTGSPVSKLLFNARQQRFCMRKNSFSDGFRGNAADFPAPEFVEKDGGRRLVSISPPGSKKPRFFPRILRSSKECLSQGSRPSSGNDLLAARDIISTKAPKAGTRHLAVGHRVADGPVNASAARHARLRTWAIKVPACPSGQSRKEARSRIYCG